MDSNIKMLIEENLNLSRDNNQLLKKLYRIQRFAQIVRVLYWVIIVLIAIGAFYYIKPLLGNLLNIYTGGISGIDNIGNITNKLNDKQQIEDLLKNLQ